jgi:hypothetical protein
LAAQFVDSFRDFLPRVGVFAAQPGGSLSGGWDQELLLAARPPSRLQRRSAYCAMACLLAVFCIAVPYANVQLQPVPAFVPIYVTINLINDLITADLIVSQYWVVRWTWLLVLASGYFYTALMIVPTALTFPGVFAPAGLLGAGCRPAPGLAQARNWDCRWS